MSQHPYTPMSLEGSRALRRSSGDDHQPGLDTLNWGTILGGSALAAYGLLKRRGILGLVLGGAGAAIAYRSIQKSGMLGNSMKRLMLHTGASSPVELAASMTIERPVDEIYNYWHDFQNLPRVLGHIESVQMRDGDQMQWVAQLPGGMNLEWNARLLEDRPNELIAWQSIEGSDIYNEGFVTFRPVFGGEATEMHVRIIYRPPAGQLGARIARFFDTIQQQVIREDLRTFKQRLETGQVPTTAGQPSARGGDSLTRMERLM